MIVDLGLSRLALLGDGGADGECPLLVAQTDDEVLYPAAVMPQDVGTRTFVGDTDVYHLLLTELHHPVIQGETVGLDGVSHLTRAEILLLEFYGFLEERERERKGLPAVPYEPCSVVLLGYKTE